MGLKDCMTDTVFIMKNDGNTYGPIKAHMMHDMMVTYDVNIIINTGDRLIRKLSNGGKESYTVLDPRYYEGHDRMITQYQLIVRKEGIMEDKADTKNIPPIYINGNNKVNINSTDNSININYNDDIMKEINKLFAEVSNLEVNKYNKAELTEIIEAIRDTALSEKPNKTIIKALLDKLPYLANFLSIGTSIMTLISKLYP